MPDQETEATAAEKLKVFVSYSRADVAFADQLVAMLADAGFDPIIDRHDIDPAEKWKTRLGDLIFTCDKVVFILTETSAGSPV
ncbi:MAG: toll/interleukin-1 receptor domain-containing protein, partial [Pseudomonadota bacterium]